ncbi:6028_t:CDS:2, partial [Racocetra fulgida]
MELTDQIHTVPKAFKGGKNYQQTSSNCRKRCSRCDKYKNLNKFTRQIGSQIKEGSNCNKCAKTKKEKKPKAISEPTSIESLNITENYVNDKYEDIAWFSLTDMEILIANCFKSEEYSCVHFSRILKFDEDFVNNVSSENQKSDKEVTYCKIAESLL